MCTIVGLNQNNCAEGDGGVRKTFICSATDITDITFDVNNQITGFTMATTGKWKKFQFDTDNDAAYMNQTGTRTNNKHIFDQETLMPFSGLTNDLRTVAMGLIRCCALVAITFTSNKKAMVQGITWDETLEEWDTSKKKAKATADFNTQTGADNDLMNIRINSQDSQLACFTTLTETALLAL